VASPLLQAQPMLMVDHIELRLLIWNKRDVAQQPLGLPVSNW
jgi:hypothetical protein